jgi:EAL and modified HD-GYP domain-containing signal transduction protein
MQAGDRRQTNHIMMGRQPILDRRRAVLGYQLLFRAAAAGAAGAAHPNPTSGEGFSGAGAAADVIAEGVRSVGLDRLTHGQPAFIELTPDLLRPELIDVLPPDRVILQVPCGGTTETSLEEACAQLRARGYRIALGRFTPAHHELVRHASFLKFDVARPEDAGAMARIGTTPAVVSIAEGVDAVTDYERAVRAGFTRFQGFFFEQPAVFQAKALPRGQIGYLRLLCALNDPNLSVQGLEDLMKRDASLCYRMLRTVNSAAFAQSREVTSIKHALLLLGRDTIRRWASLWVLTDLGAEAPTELTTMASLRGRFCELLCGAIIGPEVAGEGFLLGMCSCLDVILERPMAAIVEELPMGTDTIAALLGRDNASRRLLECVMAYERGHWDAAIGLADELAIDRTQLASSHADALTWAHHLQSQPRRPARVH